MVALAECACYFDESNDEQIHVVGGYLAPVEIWDDIFSPAWQKVLSKAPHRITEFKTSDCRNGFGEFGPPWTKEQRDRLTADLVSVILDSPIYCGVSAAFFWPGKADPSSPKVGKWRRQMEQVGYAHSLAMCLGHAFHLAGQLPEVVAVQPVLDKKSKFFHAVDFSYKTIKELLGPGLTAKLSFPMQGDSKLLAPLQAADLIAHETFKEVIGRCENRKPSMALERLTSGRIPYNARCLAMPPLLAYEFLRMVGRRPRPTEFTLFKGRGKPLREPRNWGVP